MNLTTDLRHDARASTLPEPGRSGWLHVCNGLDPIRDGGMVPSILGMAAGLAGQGGDVTIATSTPSRLGDATTPVSVQLLSPVDDLDARIARAEIVHFHGLWQRHTRVGARAARRAGVPYVMTLHGMADPWALRAKALKKRLYRAVIEGRNLRKAACLHALSKPEIGHLKGLTTRPPICFVPNGVDLAPFEGLPDRSALEAELPQILGKFVLLFFGRLHPKKGLDLLAKAFAAVSKGRPDLHLIVAGNDDGSLAPFLGEIEAGGASDRVTCLGHVSGEAARKVWGAADAFLLPSYSEGFSMAVLEALAAGRPTLISTACHFPELGRAGAGIVVEPTAEAVTEGLRDLLDRSDLERRAMADRGRRLVEAEYTWERQAERLAAVYQWVLGGGQVPEAIESTGGR